MKLDPEICYLALQSRDARFDGRFFTAVVTTGVYCRPVCPAPRPRRENVRFFPCAAAAEAAGFRPCMRCRPEASPGTPAWLGTSSTVSRAMRMISEGVLDEIGIDDLATRLGMGARHLRRLFEQHLGATPIAVAQSRRVHLAKKLIDETALPISEIAFSAGFASIRRFNDSFGKIYGRPPSDFRRNQKHTPPDQNSAIQIRLAFRPPYDWHSLIRFLGPRAIPGIEFIQDDCYRRFVAFDECAGMIEVRLAANSNHLLLTVPLELSKGLAQIVERVRTMFDLRADPQTIDAHLRRDPLLAALVKAHPGLRVPGAWDGFELAARAILGQQVSVKAATTLMGRLVKRYGEEMEGAGGEGRYKFPIAERLSRARSNDLGMPSQRAASIRKLAHAVHRGHLKLSAFMNLEEAIQKLTAIPGIGKWTAHYIAMRALGEPDAFPSTDLGLRHALEGKLATPFSEEKLLAVAERWRPWRAYAVMHLWNSE